MVVDDLTAAFMRWLRPSPPPPRATAINTVKLKDKIMSKEVLKDVAADAAFLAACLREYEADGCQCDLSVREWCNHISPALARMEMALTEYNKLER